MDCLDSYIIIDFLICRKDAVNYIQRSENNLATIVINIFEAYFGGYRIGRIEGLEDFFSSLKVLDLDYNASRKAAEMGFETGP